MADEIRGTRRCNGRAAVAAGLLLLGAGAARAQSIGPYTPPPAGARRLAEPAPRIAQHGTIPSPLVLRPAAVDARDRLDAMEAWNRAGREPAQTGFTRPLPDPIAARFAASSSDSRAKAEPHSVRARSATGPTFWGTRVTVPGAYGVRLRLSGVTLPPGTRFWSYGAGGTPVAFGLELRDPAGGIWTPIAFGETAFLDVEVPSSGAEGGFTIVELAEIRPLAAGTPPPCAIDAACVEAATFPAIAEGRRAVALLQFMVGNAASSCTGTLLNDTARDGIPYLLTAHHCISNPTEAASVHALWDFDAPTCGGTVPDPSSLESSSGSTLLATGAGSDFCLLQLSSVPPGRSFMGWDARASSLVPGTTFYCLSHPVSYLDIARSPLPMEFSESVLDESAACFGASTSSYFYSNLSAGYEWYGSSGSAAMLGGGEVVGQLKGVCAAIIQVCDAPPTLFDGAFAATYPFVARWLDAPSPSCVPDPATLCLSSRFQVTAKWNKPDGTSGFGTAVSLTPDSGYFWFFDPSNVEIVTKVVSGCGSNGRHWVFASGLTNLGVLLTYTDLGGGIQKTYPSAAGTAFQPIQDTAAFATCP